MISVPTGYVYRRSGPQADTWYAKYRLPDGRQVKKRIGPAWTSRGCPAAGYFTKRTAEGWLGDLLGEARRGTLPGMAAGLRPYAAGRSAGAARMRSRTTAAADFNLSPAFVRRPQR